MVVPVFITNCQVSEYLNMGPLTAQTIMTIIASKKAAELPVAAVAQFENRSKEIGFFFIGMILKKIISYSQTSKHTCDSYELIFRYSI